MLNNRLVVTVQDKLQIINSWKPVTGLCPVIGDGDFVPVTGLRPVTGDKGRVTLRVTGDKGRVTRMVAGDGQ